MPGDPGATVVTNSCATYTLRTRLRVQRAPGIPHALCWADRLGTTRAQRVARWRRCVWTLHVIARSAATKQSTLAFLLPHGLLRFARNDGLAFAGTTLMMAQRAYAHTPGTIDLPGGVPLLGRRHRETMARTKAPSRIAGSEMNHGTAFGRQDHRHDD